MKRKRYERKIVYVDGLDSYEKKLGELSEWRLAAVMVCDFGKTLIMEREVSE